MFIVCILVSVVQPPDRTELTERTRAGFEKVVAARREWKFTAHDSRYNSAAEPREFFAKDVYNGRDSRFLLRYSSQLPAGAAFEEITAFNRAYSFVVNRNSSGPWTLKKLHGESTAVPRTDLGVEEPVVGLLMPDFKVFIHRWDSLVSDASFRISEMRKDAHEWMVRFEADGPFFRGSRIVRGTATVDPELCFLRKFDAVVVYQSGEASNFSGSTTYQGDISSVPVPLRHYYQDVDTPSGTIVTSRTITYEHVAPGDLNKTDAMLSAFGLPEPASAGTGSVPIWLLCVTLGTFCLLLAVWLRWKRT